MHLQRNVRSHLLKHSQWYGYLYDYVDGRTVDWSVRPNMVFAVAPDYSPLDQKQRRGSLRCWYMRVTPPKGLRSLSQRVADIIRCILVHRVNATLPYHQGTAWPWLGGFYLEACLKLYRQTRLSFVERQLVGYEDEMINHCLSNTLPELFDGNPPFNGRGAISFAMNVAEVLRTLELLEKYKF